MGEREGYTDEREGGLYRWERGRAIQMGERDVPESRGRTGVEPGPLC